MRAFTPASISLLSCDVSGHGYRDALNLRADDTEKGTGCTDLHSSLDAISQLSFSVGLLSYPSQIFLTLFFS